MSEQKKVNLWELSDFCTPWCVHVVATLKIANHLADEISSIAELAQAAGCDPDMLHGVMGHLAGKGLFDEIAPGRFALNEASRDLLHPLTQAALDLDGLGGRFALAWSTLLPLVRTGEPAYHQVFGMPFFEDLHAHPPIAEVFDAIIGPDGHGTPSADFSITEGWEAVHTVVDVGGGTGAMLAEILRAHPHLSGILVDLPGTVDRSGAIFQAAGVTDRVATASQSFFDPLPPGADIYLLRGILNNWPDSETQAILLRCAEAARPDGRVVILKSVSPDGTPKDMIIEMVLLGGKHRNLSEFRELAHGAGLKVTAAEQQPAYFVVECRPV